MAFSPLAQGLLTGKYNDGKFPIDSRFKNNEENRKKFFKTKEKTQKLLKSLNGLGELAK